MEGKRVYLFYVALFFLALLSAPAAEANLSVNLGSFNQSFPGPDLIYPVTEDIDLTAKDYLEFKWRNSNFFSFTRYYDLRLYEGYNTTESSRILKEHINLQDYPFRVDARELQKDKVYTWVLIQVLNDGRKSDKSFASFKIIRKQERPND